MTLLKIWEQHLDEEKILNMVSLEKDVDGFNPLNMGNLAMRGREPLFIPCTAKGCIELLLRSGVEIMGKKAVVIGRSNIAGLPTSLLLQVTVLFIYCLIFFHLASFTAADSSLLENHVKLCLYRFAEAPCNSQHPTRIVKEPRSDHPPS